MNDTVAGLAGLRMRLREARRATDRAALLEGVLRTLFWSVAALILALLAEGTLRLAVPLRAVLAAAVLLVPLALAAWGVLPPLLRLLGMLRGETDEQTALRVGKRFPALRDRLVNGLQLAREQEGYYSAPLIDASLQDVDREAAGLDFTSVVDARPAARHARRLAVVMAAGAVAWLAFAPMFNGAAQRLRHFSTAFVPPPPFLLEVEPGTVEVVKGATVPVRVRVIGAAPREVTLGVQPEGQSAVERMVLTPDSVGVFTASLGPLKRSTVYVAAAGDQRSEEYTLRVVDRPAVRMLRLSLAFPSYTRLPPRQLDENVGDVTALRGTRIAIAVESTKDLAAAAVVYDSGEESPLAVEGSRAAGSVTLARDRRYTLRLTDREGLANQDPIEYRLSALPDAPPQITLELPGRDLAVTDNSTVTLAARVRDDFGFSAVRLAYRLSQSRYERPTDRFTVVPLPLPAGGVIEAFVHHLWPLAGMNLVPEDVVTYYLEVADNDAVTGPKTARTPEFTLRLPSMEEVFAAADRGHEEGIRSLQETLKEAEQARTEAEELRRELQKQQQRMDWQEQKKAQEVLQKYEDIRKRVDAVQKTVDEMLQQMQQQNALSPETLEKYRQLQELMEQMNSPEFADAMKKMQQAMQQMSPEMMRDALKNFSFSEENFRRGIERTMNLLKRLQIEQKMEESIRRAEDMLRNQEEAARRAEESSAGDRRSAEEIARRQEELAREAERASSELRDLERKMQEFPADMPLEEMREARASIDSTGLDEDMRETARELREGDREASRQLQQRSLRSLAQHRDRLQQAQKAMQSNQQRQVMNEMRRSLEDLLGLSRRQEELKNDARTLEQNSQRFRENAAQQMDVMRELSSLAERMGSLSNKTFSVSPEMGKAMGDAMRKMNDAMQALDQRDALQAGGQQQGAMASLNEAASLVQGAMNAMLQGGGQGMGMASFLQRLQQMSGQQQGINQATQQMGGLTPQQAAELGRLAGEQGMVRKSLEQLAREAAQAGELSKLLGDLNRTAQEMREVQTDLAQGNVNTETLRKQDRILSRLLDSQRSARERDYEKQRRAETGTTTARRTPGPVDMTTQEGKERLRQDLLRALEEGYARDYQELIRRYFEALDTAAPTKANTP